LWPSKQDNGTGVIFGGVFSKLRGVRRAQGKRYALEPLLCAIVSSLRTIEVFIGERRARLNELFGTDWRKAQSWVGIRKFLLQLDEHDLEKAVRTFAQKQVCAPPGRQFIALDGLSIKRKCHENREPNSTRVGKVCEGPL
jgi:hypothetical protein